METIFRLHCNLSQEIKDWGSSDRNMEGPVVPRGTTILFVLGAPGNTRMVHRMPDWLWLLVVHRLSIISTHQHLRAACCVRFPSAGVLRISRTSSAFALCLMLVFHLIAQGTAAEVAEVATKRDGNSRLFLWSSSCCSAQMMFCLEIVKAPSQAPSFAPARYCHIFLECAPPERDASSWQQHSSFKVWCVLLQALGRARNATASEKSMDFCTCQLATYCALRLSRAPKLWVDLRLLLNNWG